jgi:hypothetical protein
MCGELRIAAKWVEELAKEDGLEIGARIEVGRLGRESTDARRKRCG